MQRQIYTPQIFIALLIIISFWIPTGTANGYSPDITQKQTDNPFQIIHNDVPYYSQCNGYWSNTTLGRCNDTVCSKGCAVSAVAMVFSYYGVSVDPGTLDHWLTSHCGYQNYDQDKEIWTCGGCQIVWVTAAKYTSQITYEGTFGRDWDRLQLELDHRHPVILDVGQHFVVATGYEQTESGHTYFVNDSGYEAQTLAEYGNTFRRMFVYHPVTPDLPPQLTE